MIKHEIKNCPRCHEAFECKAGSITICQCTGIKLTREESDFINSLFDDCLCIECLKVLKSVYQIQKHQEI